MYSVEWEQGAVSQLSALPPGALPFFAELVTVLQVEPWSGDPYDRQRADANMRTVVAARAVGIHVNTGYKLVKRGEFPCIVLRLDTVTEFPLLA